MWRQQLVELPEVIGIARPGDGIVVAAIGKKIAAYEGASGKLKWDNEFEKDVLDFQLTKEGNAAVLFADGEVTFLESLTGEVAWKKKVIG